jgi:hypothetical protein
MANSSKATGKTGPSALMSWAQPSRRARGAVAAHRLSRRRRPRVRPPDKGDAGRHEQTRQALPQASARARRDREALPPLPRSPPHLADTRSRGRQPPDLRAGSGGALTRVDHRAVHARRPGPVPRGSRKERGSDVWTPARTRLTGLRSAAARRPWYRASRGRTFTGRLAHRGSGPSVPSTRAATPSASPSTLRPVRHGACGRRSSRQRPPRTRPH